MNLNNSKMTGYTLFNLFFPKLVELRLGKHAEGGTLTQALWNVVIYTLGGTPGALVRSLFHSYGKPSSRRA